MCKELLKAHRLGDSSGLKFISLWLTAGIAVWIQHLLSLRLFDSGWGSLWIWLILKCLGCYCLVWWCCWMFLRVARPFCKSYHLRGAFGRTWRNPLGFFVGGMIWRTSCSIRFVEGRSCCSCWAVPALASLPNSNWKLILKTNTLIRYLTTPKCTRTCVWIKTRMSTSKTSIT